MTIILARLLSPEDFGVLAVVNVFYLLTNSFIDGGLKDALIRKQGATDAEYSSVFWMNLILAILFYLILFTAAPIIQDFYGYENLTFFIRLQALSLIIDSLALIQIVKSVKDLNLKKVSQARIPASLISFIVGILMAYMGFGVVALITQQLVNSALYVTILWFRVKYIPSMDFSWRLLMPLYGFGLKLFIAGYLNRIYVQSMNLIFAKFYSPAPLGLYTKAKNLQLTPSSLVIDSIASGIYPTMVKLQDDNSKLKAFYVKNIQITFALICGISTLMYFQAEIIVSMLLGNKWLDMVPFLKVLAIGGLFMPLTQINRNMLKVKGLAGLYLKLEVIRKVMLIALIFFFINYSFITTIIAITCGGALMTIIDMHFAGLKIKYTLIEQLVDILPYFIIIFSVGLFTNYLIGFAQLNEIYQLGLFSMTFFVLSALIIFFLKRKIINEIILLFK